MKRLRHLCLLLTLLAFPASASADVGARLEVRFATGIVVPSSMVAVANAAEAPQSYMVFNATNDSTSGFMSTGRLEYNNVWSQTSGTSSAQLTVWTSGHWKLSAAYECQAPGAGEVAWPRYEGQWRAEKPDARVISVGSVALTAAPYQIQVLTVPTATNPALARAATAAELDFLARVNAERARLGRPALQLDTRASLASISHSQFQDSLGAASAGTHCGRVQSKVGRRLMEVGIDAEAMSEVVSVQDASHMSGQATWDTYSKSAAHMSVLTKAEYTCIGIGFGSTHTTAELYAGSCDTNQTGVKLADVACTGVLASCTETYDDADEQAGVVVNGRARVGQLLTCVAPSYQVIAGEPTAWAWMSTASADSFSSAYESNASLRMRTYRVRAADAGRFLRCSANGLASPSVRVAAAGPRMIRAPRLIGKAQVGRRVSCNLGRWERGTRVNRALQMKVGARWRVVSRRPSIVLGRQFRGKVVRCQVTARKGMRTRMIATRAVRVSR